MINKQTASREQLNGDSPFAPPLKVCISELERYGDSEEFLDDDDKERSCDGEDSDDDDHFTDEDCRQDKSDDSCDEVNYIKSYCFRHKQRRFVIDDDS